MDQRDLGGVADEIHNIIKGAKESPERHLYRAARRSDHHGSSRSRDCELGIAFAVIIVYLLMAVNFQSWLDPADYFDGVAGRVFWNFVDALYHADNLQRAFTHGFDHDNRRGDRQFDPAGGVCERRARAGIGRNGGGSAGRIHTAAAGLHDCLGDDYRYAADGAGVGRRRGAECAAGPSGDWRFAFCDRQYAVHRADHVLAAAQKGAS